MSEPDEELEPLMVEITADVRPFMEATHRLQSAMMFAFHPNLFTPDERAVRSAAMRAWDGAADFQESMQALTTQTGAAPDEVARLQEAVRRLAGPVHPDEEPQ